MFKPPYNIGKLDSFIRYRLKRLIAQEVVKTRSKDRKQHYSTTEDKVLFGNGILKNDGLGEIEMGYFIVVKRKDGTIAKSIDEYEKKFRIGKFSST